MDFNKIPNVSTLCTAVSGGSVESPSRSAPVSR